ncbi:MAG: hypothetical protein COY68_04070 [Candidatus Levybacteria bacterium CG_4_10_14_0_8_um_filter_35_23]|nr:MAG: hypothetical protein COY68_04070 [Candidatus Levybacteria bacterium CG_4_10_14_0_8_um_filter_35_23]
MNKQIREAVKILNNGGIVIFPTDTALGISCRMDNKKAVERLFKLRKRPQSQPTPVLVNSVQMAQKYLLPIPEELKNKLIKKYWPGGLTIILPCRKGKVSVLVRGGGNNLGVRIPNDKQILKIIAQVGVPILAPSANFSGEKTPYKTEDLDNNLVKLVDYILPGTDAGKSHQHSTVIDCSVYPWKILREGAVKVKSNNSKKIILSINTADSNKILISLNINRVKKEVSTENKKGSQVILLMIDQLLKKNSLNIHNISEIKVNTGPGSFTGLRVGVSVANTLASSLKIPINDKKLGYFEEPKY